MLPLVSSINYYYNYYVLPLQSLTGLDFANYLTLLEEEMEQAQVVLGRLEQEAAKVGLYRNLNCKS